jgi:DNA-binding GntR family transcriptional regulator
MSKMQQMFAKIPSTTLRVKIAERIREAILVGTLQEGERLVERELAAQFETSLTAVREALIELESDGFVVKKANTSTFVTKLTPEAAEKIFVVRRLIEKYAVEEAARMGTKEQLEELEKLYQEMIDAARNRETKEFVMKDLSLHQFIWSMSGNEYLVTALERSVLPIFAFSAIRIASHNTMDLMEDAYSHTEILRAIRAKDPEAAGKAFLAALDDWSDKTSGYVFGESDSTTASQ